MGAVAHSRSTQSSAAIFVTGTSQMSATDEVR